MTYASIQQFVVQQLFLQQRFVHYGFYPTQKALHIAHYYYHYYYKQV